MVRHSVVAYRDDNPDGEQKVTFADNAWLGYVPIRMPDTICVQERLPPGAAAVMINQNHTHKDLYMLIDLFEKGLFDSIDGNRSIGDIVEIRMLSPQRQTSQLEGARSFFERLWLYDQVVFKIANNQYVGVAQQ